MTKSAVPVRRRWLRWRTLFIAIAVLLVIACPVAIFIGRSMIVTQPEPNLALTVLQVPVEQRDLIEQVQVVGALEPRDRAKVSFPDGVRVSEVLVSEGEKVTKGQVLARLETRDLELKVSSSQAQLDQTVEALAKLEKGPSESELVKASANVARARAAITALAQEVRPVDVDTARATLEAARKVLVDLEKGVPPSDLREAEQTLLNTQEALDESRRNLEKVRDTASRAKQQAQQAMERGQQDVVRAQRAFSDAYWDWDFVQRTKRHPRDTIINEAGRTVQRPLDDVEVEQFRRAFEDAENGLKNAEEAQQSLVDAYDLAREDEIKQIEEAERAIAKAERNLAEVQRTFDATRTDGLAAALLKARKDVADAEKALNDLTNNPERPARRAESQAALLEAIAAEQKLKEGPDAIELAKARTEIELAKAALAKAEADLEAATLRAPIDGTVVALRLKAGTLTTSSDAVDIADLTRFMIRARVTEQDVARVTTGMSVTVSIDAVPEQPFSGRLTRVSELPETNNQGSDPGGGPFGVNPSGALGGLYPIEIVVDAQDRRVRVGMATTSNIEITALRNVLAVPFQAVEQRPDGTFVRRVVGDAPDSTGQPVTEEVAVELGPVVGDSVQILRGLQAGDLVVLSQVPPAEQMPVFENVGG
jgi:multidrug efflux pump subunit AcrA (membrane-fusion protein)